MDERIDLHVHSTCSDGTYTPSELSAYAAKKGLKAYALTDHDTMKGIEEARLAAEKYGIELISGIELSTSYKNADVHIVGLGIDTQNQKFQEELKNFQDSRNIRNKKIIALLQEQGIDITYEKMQEEFGEAVCTRAHIARFLMEHRYVKDMESAFTRYIGDHAPCFVAREKVTPAQAIELIHQGGGYAVLAHPLAYHFTEKELDTLVSELALVHLDALEAIYSTNHWTDESNMKRLARKYNLKISGGSDFHGDIKPEIDLGDGYGNLKIPYELWTILQQK